MTKVSQKSGRRKTILYIPLERAFKVLLEFVLKSNPKRVDFKITISELTALFRNESHPNYKPCGDQLLRNFLNGLIIYKRGKQEEPPKS